MTKTKWRRLVSEANRLLLTPFEKLSKSDQKAWLNGTRAILRDLRGSKAGGSAK